jgi:catechol 2,3-dioxygenase-like lactoylglutathione lyase family enzyme
MRRIHHINLGVPPDLVDAERDFLVDILGYRLAPLDPAAEKFGALWFDADDGTQIHLSRDEGHVPAAQAHTAIAVGDEIDDIEKRLDAAGARYKAGEFGGTRLLFCADPAGNRFELRHS